MCELCAQRINNMNTSDLGKKYRLLQAKSYKKGLMDKIQKAEQVQAKVNLLIQSCWLPA